jgi:phenylacetate-coenzyme A ligase PaaK-like adenylate-forming protein
MDRVGEIDSVKVVLCTAGPLLASEKMEITKFFNAKLCMEYGSVEGGCMAYTRPSDGCYNVNWNTHIIQAVKDKHGKYKNIVTKLTSCYVPLIRYDIGDYLELIGTHNEDDKRSVLEIADVLGRPSEMISFACGVSFFGALIGDCVKQVKSVIGSQIAIDEAANYLEIRVVASRTLTNEEKHLIVERFGLTVENAKALDICVRQCEKLDMTVGGKIPRIVRVKK